MRILGIDTSGRGGSIALLDGGERLRLLTAEREYSRTLVPAIESLLEEAGCDRARLDGLAVAVGPGAFTGLRVGIGTAQGLALALGRPCIGVNTLEAWAAPYTGEPQVVVALDAFRGDVLWTLFEQGLPGGLPAVGTPEAFAQALPTGALIVGPGALLYKASIEARRPDVRWAAHSPSLAGRVALLGRAALQRGAAGSALELKPVYLREAYATRP